MNGRARAVAVLVFFSLSRFGAASGLEDAADVLRVALPLWAGAYAWREDDSEGQRQWLIGTAATLGTAYALKALISEERPDGSDDDAFPSGHAAAAFSGAAFLHRRYGLVRVMAAPQQRKQIVVQALDPDAEAVYIQR